MLSPRRLLLGPSLAQRLALLHELFAFISHDGGPTMRPAPKRLTGTAGHPPITPYQAAELAGDLLAELSQHVGDAEAITPIMRHWHNVLGPERFGVVCIASVRIHFRDQPAADAPAGALAYSYSKENTA